MCTSGVRHPWAGHQLLCPSVRSLCCMLLQQCDDPSSKSSVRDTGSNAVDVRSGQLTCLLRPNEWCLSTALHSALNPRTGHFVAAAALLAPDVAGRLTCLLAPEPCLT